MGLYVDNAEIPLNIIKLPSYNGIFPSTIVDLMDWLKGKSYPCYPSVIKHRDSVEIPGLDAEVYSWENHV